MGNKPSFLNSLERYAWKRVKESPVPWSWIGIVLVIVVVAASIGGARQSSAQARSKEELVKIAALRGDYDTAQEYFDDGMGQIVDLVYPSRKIEARIEELTDKLTKYPESIELYLGIASLYEQVGEMNLSAEYREKARILNPNPEISD